MTTPHFLTAPHSQAPTALRDTRQDGGKLRGGETEREMERESGGGRQRELLMKNMGMGGRQKN